ncbi:MAG: DinB family protein, partial [Planctomycetota bacterium]|nr:DinB family protein [Planctomycetota bacterium]
MDDLIRDLDDLLARFEHELTPLDDEQLARKPADGGWSAREVFGHLETTARLYLEKIEAAVERLPEGRSSRPRPPRPGMFGGALLGALRKTGKRLRSPRLFRPPLDAAEGSLDELIAVHRRLRRAAKTIGDRNLEAVRIGTPVSRLL